MKRVLFFLLITFLLSGCYVGFRSPYYRNYNPYPYRYKRPYYKNHQYFYQRIQPNKKYKQYFRPGKY